MFGIVKVQGRSMEPRLGDGDFVLICRFLRRLRLGDLVVCKHDCYPRLIKQVAGFNDQGYIRLTGLNEQSLSSEQMGWIKPEQVEGKVLWSLRAP